jgi:copper(I)-binding protein
MLNLKRLLPCVFLALSAMASAQVQVKDPWVRATVPAQKSSGAFMQLSAKEDARLISVRSPVAGIVELHQMSLVDNVMRMSAVKGIEIPAGRGAELKPGGYHVMLLDLKQQLKEGDTVPMTLVVEGKDRKRQTIEVKATVRSLQATGPAARSAHHEMKH